MVAVVSMIRDRYTPENINMVELTNNMNSAIELIEICLQGTGCKNIYKNNLTMLRRIVTDSGNLENYKTFFSYASKIVQHEGLTLV